LKTFFLHQERRKEEQERRNEEREQRILGAMTSKLVNHDQQLAYLNSNAVMKDQHQSDLKEIETDILKKVEKKITDSETKLTKKIEDETIKKIQPRSLDFGGPTSPSSSSPFAGPGSEGPPQGKTASSGAPPPSFGWKTAASSSSFGASSLPTSSSLSSSSKPAAGPMFMDTHLEGAAALSSSPNSAAGPMFTFKAPNTRLGGPPASSLLSSSNSAAGPFTFNAPSNSDSAAGPFTLSHDSKIPAVDPANLYDELSQIELPTVQVGSSSNIIVTDDNAPTTSVLPTEDIALPVRTRPFRLTLPAQAAPFIQAQPSSVQAQPSSVQGNAMNLSTQAQPSLFELFGAPQGWECKDCLLRNVEGAEVCFHCIEK